MSENLGTLTKHVGIAIRTRRKSINMSQEALSEYVGIGQQSLSRMEQGKIAPKFERLQLFADALGCDVKDFFSLSSNSCEESAITIAKLLKPLSQEQRKFVLGHVGNLVEFLSSQNKT